MGKLLSATPRKRRRRQEVDFLGTWVPKESFQYVTLHCIANQVSKTKVIRKLIADWHDAEFAKQGVHDLERTIAKRMFLTWKEMNGKSFKAFLAELRFELKQKKFDPEQVESIIKKVEYEEEKSREKE